MSYEVIKTINGNEYRYLQRSYRVNGKVKTESIYLGPVKPKRGILSLLGDLAGALQNAAMIKHIWRLDPTPEQLEKMERERAAQDRINSLLHPDHRITMAELQEVIDFQHPGEREDTPEEAARVAAMVAQVPEFAPSADASPTPSEQLAEASPSEEPSEPSTPAKQSDGGGEATEL